MKLVRWISAGLLCGLLCIVSAGAYADQATGWYIGAGAGQTDVKDAGCTDDYSAVFADISCSDDSKDTGWKIFAGSQLTPNAAIEFGFVDLGAATIKGTDSVFGSTKATAEADGFFVAGVGSIPLGQSASLLGKVGLFNWSVDAAIDTSIGSASEDDSGTDLMFGFGAMFNMSRDIALRLEWERFSDVGDDDTTGKSDVDMLSASILFRL